MKIIFLLLTVTLSIQTYAHEKGKKNDHHNNRHHKINLDISLIPYFKQDQQKCETPWIFDKRKCFPRKFDSWTL